MNKFLRFHDQIIAGIAVAMIGIFLIVNREYFFWPPEWSSLLNNICIDVIIMVAGEGLVLSAYFNNRFKLFKNISFILSGAVVLALSVTQIVHIIYAGQSRMIYTVIGDLVIFALILLSAYDS